jgi:osmotically-inducible protein OsmY
MTRRTTKAAACAAVVTAAFAFAGVAAANDDKAKTEPDNTKRNEAIVERNAPTAESQSNDKGDMELTAKVRRAIVDDESLSTYAHNVKIVSNNGSVYLSGPVRTEAERQAVERIAAGVAGKTKVKSDVAVAPQK